MHGFNTESIIINLIAAAKATVPNLVIVSLQLLCSAGSVD